jgi:sortase A
LTEEPTRAAAGRRRRARSRGLRVADAIGVAGEVLVTLGVLLGLFVVWQLWWTDVPAHAEQRAIVAALDWPDPPAPGPGEGAGGTTPPVGRTDPAPVLPEPAHGTTFATIAVPRWGGEAMPVSEGTTKRDVLDRKGIGHYEGTAMPGAVGNFAVAGHRTTYGKPFHRVEELRVGDPVVVRTEDTWYVYAVTSTEVVAPSDVDVIAPVPGDPGAAPALAQMTMTTCHPMYSARERYVVHLVLDHWLPVADGTPAELTGAGSGAEGSA